MENKRIELKAENGIWLRQFFVGDAPVIFGLIEGNRTHLSQFGDETADKYPTLQSAVESISHPANPQKLRFGIWDRDVYTGTINLIPKENDKVEVGYYLGKEFEGRGYMRIALKRITAYALGERGFKEIFATVARANERSKNTLLKCDFRVDEANSNKKEVRLYIQK